MCCKDTLLLTLLEHSDEAPLQVRVKKHVGFIQNNSRGGPMKPQMEQKLQPNVQPVSGPVDLLFGPAPNVPVEDVEPFSAIAPAAGKF